MHPLINEAQAIASALAIIAGAVLGVFAILAGHAFRAVWSALRAQQRSALVLDRIVRDLALNREQEAKLRSAWFARYTP